MVQPRNRRPLYGALFVLLCATVIVYLVGGWANQKLQGNQFRAAEISRCVEAYLSVKVGNDVKEVEAKLGSAPDAIDNEIGFLKSPNMLLVGKAAEGHGELVTYELYRWSFEECHTVVVFDLDGVVVGKWIWGADYVNRRDYGVKF